jgi:hypothetical protein
MGRSSRRAEGFRGHGDIGALGLVHEVSLAKSDDHHVRRAERLRHDPPLTLAYG